MSICSRLRAPRSPSTFSRRSTGGAPAGAWVPVELPPWVKSDDPQTLQYRELGGATDPHLGHVRGALDGDSGGGGALAAILRAPGRGRRRVGWWRGGGRRGRRRDARGVGGGVGEGGRGGLAPPLGARDLQVLGSADRANAPGDERDRDDQHDDQDDEALERQDGRDDVVVRAEPDREEQDREPHPEETPGEGALVARVPGERLREIATEGEEEGDDPDREEADVVLVLGKDQVEKREDHHGEDQEQRRQERPAPSSAHRLHGRRGSRHRIVLR